MEAWKDCRIEGWKDGSPRGMDGPSRPPYPSRGAKPAIAMRNLLRAKTLICQSRAAHEFLIESILVLQGRFVTSLLKDLLLRWRKVYLKCVFSHAHVSDVIATNVAIPS